MENKEVLTVQSKRCIYNFLATKEGKDLINAIKQAHEDHLGLAQMLHTRISDPNQQIAAQVCVAAGIKEVIDFIEAIQNEIKELDKEEKAQSETEL